MSCDVGKAAQPHSPTLLPLYLHHSSLLQPFRCFAYITAHSPTLLPLHLRRSSFYNPSATSPTSQVILQLLCCFTYVTGTSYTSPGEPPMPLWWCLIYPWWFCNLQWLRPAGLHERCKLALELKRLKTPGLNKGWYPCSWVELPVFQCCYSFKVLNVNNSVNIKIRKK